MVVSDLFSNMIILNPLKVSSKKQLILKLSEKLADKHGFKSADIFEAMIDREKLGSTAVGHGVAIPHARFAQCDQIHGAFAILDKAVDYDAPDGSTVDIVVMLLAPEKSGSHHLNLLSKITRLLSNPDTCTKLRGTETSDAALAVIMGALEISE